MDGGVDVIVVVDVVLDGMVVGGYCCGVDQFCCGSCVSCGVVGYGCYWVGQCSLCDLWFVVGV